jgi:hypothetical protein
MAMDEKMTRTSALPASIYFSARLNPVRKNGAPLDWRDWSLLIGHGQLRLASPRRTPSSLAELQYSEYVSFCTCVSITEILRDIRTRAICDFLRREDELMTELMNHKRSTS